MQYRNYASDFDRLLLDTDKIKNLIWLNKYNGETDESSKQYVEVLNLKKK